MNTEEEDDIMLARAPLMIEHRLIERMLAIVRNILVQIGSEHRVDPVTIDAVVDFIRMYADRTHHGKEEDILFRALERKHLFADDRQIMTELIAEHVFGRETTKTLVDANARYRDGDDHALTEIAESLHTLDDFYPRHIEKEDKVFFPSSRVYFTDAEDQAMLREFYEFDRKMIHEKYKSVVDIFEKQR